MQSGVCPKCNKEKVYAIETIGPQARIYISGLVPAELTYYICSNCGYVEQYITNHKELQKLKKHGKHVDNKNN